MNQQLREPTGNVRRDLQDQARAQGRGSPALLTMYVAERWLARMSRSPFAEDFALKGGMLLAAWGHRRPTMDVDVLARHIPDATEILAHQVAEIAALEDEIDDGVQFLPKTTATMRLRETALYSGVRVTMSARLDTALVKLHLDVNFGDPVTPEPSMVELPGLRAGTAPVQVLGYPVETVLAEKLATAIELGRDNTRMRDFGDILTLTRRHDVDYTMAREALRATAEFRQLRLQPLSAVVGDIAARRSSNYSAYRISQGPDGQHLPEDFALVVDQIAKFADPLADSAGHGTWDPVAGLWQFDDDKGDIAA